MRTRTRWEPLLHQDERRDQVDHQADDRSLDFVENPLVVPRANLVPHCEVTCKRRLTPPSEGGNVLCSVRSEPKSVAVRIHVASAARKQKAAHLWNRFSIVAGRQDVLVDCRA
jgi:hypothetical protein